MKGSYRECKENLICPNCGQKHFSQLYEECTGFETEEAWCSACGYRATHIIGSGGPDGPDSEPMRVSHKAGIIVCGFNALGDHESSTYHAHGTLVGAQAYAASGDKFDWVMYVTEKTEELVSGQSPSQESMTSAVAYARDFLSRIQIQGAGQNAA